MNKGNETPVETDNEQAPLSLLLPWDLPTQITLSPEQKQRAQQVLTTLNNALALNDHGQAHQQLQQLLVSLTDIDTQPADVEHTETPLSREEVEDYDRYFNISHIHSTQPFLSLIKGLVQSAAVFMGLCERMDKLPLQRVEQQVAGFQAYSQLLARTGNIKDEG